MGENHQAITYQLLKFKCIPVKSNIKATQVWIGVQPFGVLLHEELPFKSSVIISEVQPANAAAEATDVEVGEWDPSSAPVACPVPG